MGDTTTIKIIADSLSKIINHITESPRGLSSGEVAIIAAIVGAASAILPQLVIFILNKRNERNSVKQILIAKERSLAYLIDTQQSEFIHLRMTCSYWLQCSAISKNSNVLDKAREKAWEFDKAAADALNKLRKVKAKYYKIVTHFANLHNEKTTLKIKNELNNIRNYKIDLDFDFVDSKNIEELRIACDKGIEKANSECDIIIRFCDTINGEMQKLIT